MAHRPGQLLQQVLLLLRMLLLGEQARETLEELVGLHNGHCADRPWRPC